MSIKITFLGAAGTVTGSKTLVEAEGKRILVDCGLFQGLKALREMNWNPLLIPPSSIDAVIITHAHLDHVGYIPLLVKEGFTGNIYATAPTFDLSKIILLDSAKIQEEDAARANREAFSKHHPAKPLYTIDDARMALSQFVIHQDETWVNIFKNIQFKFRKSGHILGSVFVELDCANRRIVFSGDIGRESPLLLSAAVKPDKADYLILESTYGNRMHDSTDPEKVLAKVINETYQRGGDVIIPSFAVERAQEIILLISRLNSAKEIPEVPLYLDSPMAIDVTDVYYRYPEWHRLSAHEVKVFRSAVKYIRELDDTYRVMDTPGTKIIIAGSGMITGGRVLEYLKKGLGDSKNTILLTGYQAEGTRGRDLLEGKEHIKIYGNYYPVNAAVKVINGLSGHADKSELIDWISGISQKPVKVFLNHGEPDALNNLAGYIKSKYDWDVHVPRLDETVECF